MCMSRAMRRAHLLRSIGGGQGPLRILPQESVARAKPALEAEHSTQCCAISDPLAAPRRGSVPLSSAGFAGATISGGGVRQGGEAPLRVERTGSTPRVWPSGAASQLDPSHRSRQALLREAPGMGHAFRRRSEEHTSELQSRPHLVCRLLLEKKKKMASPKLSTKKTKNQ